MDLKQNNRGVANLMTQSLAKDTLIWSTWKQEQLTYRGLNWLQNTLMEQDRKEKERQTTVNIEHVEIP